MAALSLDALLVLLVLTSVLLFPDLSDLLVGVVVEDEVVVDAEVVEIGSVLVVV